MASALLDRTCVDTALSSDNFQSVLSSPSSFSGTARSRSGGGPYRPANNRRAHGRWGFKHSGRQLGSLSHSLIQCPAPAFPSHSELSHPKHTRRSSSTAKSTSQPKELSRRPRAAVSIRPRRVIRASKHLTHPSGPICTGFNSHPPWRPN
jgi:hypothetical protein